MAIRPKAVTSTVEDAVAANAGGDVDDQVTIRVAAERRNAAPALAPGLERSQALIKEECDNIKKLLLEKNRAYGNSAIEPKRIFSRGSPVEQIDVRIDDKLSRIASSGGIADADEDTVLDLIGYLVLRRVAVRFHNGD